jgi:hypothetical protein
MKERMFPFPRVFVAATFLVLVAWAPQPSSRAAEIQGNAGIGERSHLLDGKTFLAKTGEKGKSTHHDDTIIFRDGRFTSEACIQYGFEEKEFTAAVDGEVIRFRALTVSPKLGTMEWEGTVRGDVLEARSTWTRDRWYWKIKREYWYQGGLKK